MKKILVVSLVLSLLANVGLAAGWLHRELVGCAETPSARIGVLTRTIKVGREDGRKTVFVLPEGLMVREASASGMDWFEPHRFRIVVTTDDSKLVDYSAGAKNKQKGAEYYSADANLHAWGEVSDNER
jgi:hypothetical protein